MTEADSAPEFPTATPATIDDAISRVLSRGMIKPIKGHAVTTIWHLACEDLWMQGYGGETLVRSILDHCLARCRVERGELDADEVDICMLSLSRAAAITWIRKQGCSYLMISVPDGFDLAAATQRMADLFLDAIESDLASGEQPGAAP